MTLKQIITRLREAGVPDARFDALQLVCHTEKISVARAISDSDADYLSEELEAVVLRREKREPLQYILGEWDFYGYTFKVTPDTLSPRADTEVLCDYLVKTLPAGGRFADLCTGSGCIAVAALLSRPDASGCAVELYPETMKVARENAVRHKVDSRLEMILADVTEDCLSGKYDIIVSNPPYVTKEEMEALSPEALSEPRAALTDEGDGLSVVRKIVELYPRHLKEGGSLAVEIGWKQGEEVRKIAERNSLRCEILKDTGDRDRVAVIKAKI